MISSNNIVREKISSNIYKETVSFGNHGVDLKGTLYLPIIAGKNDRVPGAVMCHGYGADREVFENSARELAAEGVVVLTFDFRGHGSSGGMLDGSIVEDVMDAWNYLHDRPEVDHKRMGLIGHSMGAFSAILAAGKLKKAKVLVALSCPSEIRNKVALDVAHFAHPLLRIFTEIIFKITRVIYRLKVRVDWNKFIEFWPKAKPSQSLSELGDCHKLFVFCLGDIAAPYNKFVYSYATAAEPKQMLVTTGNHNSPMESASLRRQWQKWTIQALHGRLKH
jgi:alpha/beta superfamily hydrolase